MQAGGQGRARLLSEMGADLGVDLSDTGHPDHPRRRGRPRHHGHPMASWPPQTSRTSDIERPWAARRRPKYEKTGGVLLSQALAGQVPSALRGLTALFGMGRGVSPSLKPPEKVERPRLPEPFKTAQRHKEHHNRTNHLPLTGQKKNPSSPRTISTGLL